MIRKSTVNNTLKFMLTLSGIWPDASYILFCRIVSFVTTTIVLYCHCSYFVTHLYSVEVFDLMDCLCSFLAFFKVVIKCIVFWINRRKFVHILAMMTEDWNDCTKSDISMHKAIDKAKMSDRVVNMIFTLHALCIVAYCIGIMVAEVDITDQTIELPYLSKVVIPFNITTQLTYRFTLIAEFFHMLYCGCTAGIVNALLLTLTLHTAGQIDILCHWLTEHEYYQENNKNQSIVSRTRQIIQKHQKIISFSENIENLYTYIALLLFATNMIMICSIGFLIVVAMGSINAVKQIMRLLLFYTTTNLEAFIFCFAGEYLNNKSEEVSIAAYNSEWYDLKSKDSRLLLFIILRSQKQLTFTAGKMMDLSLKSFTSIMNASGSYLSVLLAMQ